MRYYLNLPRSSIVYAILYFLLVNYSGAQSVTEENLFRDTGKLYAQAEADMLIRQGKLASTAATAMVPLVFDLKGRLLTAKQFNALIDALTSENTWDAELYREFWTDFTTYQTVLCKAQRLGLQPQARVNLVKDYRYVRPPPDPRYKGPYLFDPFQKFYQTRKEIEKAIERKTRQQAP